MCSHTCPVTLSALQTMSSPRGPWLLLGRRWLAGWPLWAFPVPLSRKERAIGEPLSLCFKPDTDLRCLFGQHYLHLVLHQQLLGEGQGPCRLSIPWLLRIRQIPSLWCSLREWRYRTTCSWLPSLFLSICSSVRLPLWWHTDLQVYRWRTQVFGANEPSDP